MNTISTDLFTLLLNRAQEHGRLEAESAIRPDLIAAAAKLRAAISESSSYVDRHKIEPVVRQLEDIAGLEPEEAPEAAPVPEQQSVT